MAWISRRRRRSARFGRPELISPAVFFAPIALLCLLTSSIATAATGRITDAATGAPIKGATVFAAWYYEPARSWSLVEQQAPGHPCGGVAMAVTDASGDYELGEWVKSGRHRLSETQIWISAPDYYDPGSDFSRGYANGSTKRFPALLVTAGARTKGWSRALVSLAQADIDSRLVGLDASMRVDCEGIDANHQAAEQVFQQLVQSRMEETLCADGKLQERPSADVFGALFPGFFARFHGNGFTFLWRELVLPLLPGKSDERIGDLALRNACALLSLPHEEGPGWSIGADRFPTLRITVKDAVTGAGVPDQPVRILWGYRDLKREAYDVMHREVAARLGFIATTDVDGFIDLPVTAEMLKAQGLSQFNERSRLRYSAVPIARDRISFDQRFAGIRSLCSARGVIGHATAFEHDNSSLVAATDIGCFSALRGGLAASVRLPDTTGKRQPVAATRREQAPRAIPVVADGDAYGDLARILTAEKTRLAKGPRFPPNLSTVYTYQWRWPAVALLARVYEWITVPIDRESDPQALLQRERKELHDAFGLLCAGTGSDRVEDGEQITHELWWIETQTKSLAVANRNAQERADTWDDGPRCNHIDGRTELVGGVRPPNPLTASKVCLAWKHAGSLTGSGHLADPAPFERFTVDYSKRPFACEYLPRNGASL